MPRRNNKKFQNTMKIRKLQKKSNLPRTAKEMKACECFLILSGSISVHILLMIGNREIKRSIKSNGVTHDTSHLRHPRINNSVSCGIKKNH